MTTLRSMTAPVVAMAMALGLAGCADFVSELQTMQQDDTSSQPQPSGPGGEADLKREHVAGVAKAAEASQDAIDVAREGDRYRDAPRADYQAAHLAYRKALELEPRNTYVLAAEATCYLRQGVDEKFSNPDGSATTDPDQLDRADKWFKRAKGLADRALVVNPNYGTAHFILGEMYALMGDMPKALEKFNFIETNKLIPGGHTSTFYAWRGYVKKLNGNEADAKTDFDQAIEMAEPFELAEYADSVVNPPKAETGFSSRAQPETKAVVKAY